MSSTGSGQADAGGRRETREDLKLVPGDELAVIAPSMEKIV